MQDVYSRVMRSNVEQVMKEYLTWRTLQGYARATTRNDATALRALIRAVGSDIAIEDFDNDVMTRALAAVGETRSALSTNMTQASWSAFFRWCRMRKYMPVDNDPLIGVRYKRVSVVERRRLAIHEFPAFLEAAESPRDRMFCALGLYLFLRASEAVTLRVRDVDLQSGTINVTIHKTGDQDTMPIPSELDKELRRWLLAYQEEVGGPVQKDWFLLPARKQAGFHVHELNPPAKISRPENIIKRVLTAYGWEDTHWQGMHLLRRSGARAWFDELDANTIDGALRMVQTHLHHRSVTMTERYLGLSGDRVKRDRLLKGETMFPSLDIRDGVVTDIRKAKGNG